ncbi:MAG: pitrilysin family protein [Bacteroidia bacterium]
MINFQKFTLANGLNVIYHEDKATPLVCINILYNVGARDEDSDLTGFAHLFEHLMFGGSVNIPSYDEPLQLAGGENNAFTSSDITNYYLTLPAENMETAFWLESDRMLSLAFTPESLEVQRSVVIEEFKQRYLNQPYGDVWLHLKPLAYTTHPYQWNTIGKSIEHVANATMDDVKGFFKKHYAPNNAIMVVAGNTTLDVVKTMCEKYFAPIPAQDIKVRNLPQEPVQTAKRTLTLERNVPTDTLYKVYHMCDKLHPDYYTTDLISDILSNGKSARLYNALVKEVQLFTDINAYIMGDIDAGLFVVTGKLNAGVTFEQAETAVDKELQKMHETTLDAIELQKVKNKIESTLVFSEMNVLNKAMNLAYAELLGDANNVNKEMEHYAAVTAQDITRVAKVLFTDTNASVLYYKSVK